MEIMINSNRELEPTSLQGDYIQSPNVTHVDDNSFSTFISKVCNKEAKLLTILSLGEDRGPVTAWRVSNSAKLLKAKYIGILGDFRRFEYIALS